MSVFLKSRNPNRDVYEEYAITADEVICDKFTKLSKGIANAPGLINTAYNKSFIKKNNGSSTAPVTITAGAPIKVSGDTTMATIGHEQSSSGAGQLSSANSALVSAINSKTCVVAVQLVKPSNPQYTYSLTLSGTIECQVVTAGGAGETISAFIAPNLTGTNPIGSEAVIKTDATTTPGVFYHFTVQAIVSESDFDSDYQQFGGVLSANGISGEYEVRYIDMALEANLVAKP